MPIQLQKKGATLPLQVKVSFEDRAILYLHQPQLPAWTGWWGAAALLSSPPSLLPTYP